MSKGELYTASELEEIQAALLLLAKGILAKQQFVAWDLLLLHCRQEEGEGTAYDLRKLVALVEEMGQGAPPPQEHAGPVPALAAVGGGCRPAEETAKIGRRKGCAPAANSWQRSWQLRSGIF